MFSVACTKKAAKLNSGTSRRLFSRKGTDRARIGITTTRKMGNSVERNRARRLVREAFRRNKWLVPQGVDIVINAKRSLVGAAYRDFESEFITFLQRAGQK